MGWTLGGVAPPLPRPLTKRLVSETTNRCIMGVALAVRVALRGA